ncbi:MAG TPA: STAS domain-containing protein [Sedimentisphaerales bacterium]|nr:STAS domain-containing protein [Sedimentisphaerales bacterium]HRS09648.1 STAS domain-containing protein [Sedimentisphaerales bacterium]HRV46329.1 STAS domain-containing protein [Sedimentisphaerales bacterium]
MKINLQNYNDVTVIELQGELDGDIEESMKDTMTQTVAAGRKRIVVDMSNVSAVDSQGLELLLWVRQYCRQNRVQLRLAGLDETIEKILEITGLQTEFDRHVELAEAVRSFA